MNEPIVGSDEPHLERLADLHPDRVGRGIGPAVDRKVVRHAAFHRHRRIGQALPFEPFLQLDDVVMVGRDLVRRIGRIDDQSAI